MRSSYRHGNGHDDGVGDDIEDHLDDIPHRALMCAELYSVSVLSGEWRGETHFQDPDKLPSCCSLADRYRAQ